MKKRRVLLALCLVLLACGAPPARPSRPAPRCALDPTPEVIAIEDPIPGELHEVYDLPDTPALFAPAQEDDVLRGSLRDYRARILARIPSLDPRALLRRQLPIYSREAGPDATNIALTLEGRAGHLEPASCLEVALLARQSARFDMLRHPTELGAYVLRGNGRVRVYFSGADRVGQRMRSALTDRVEADVRSGMTLVAHLHNHPFLFDREVGDRLWTNANNVDDVGGALAPSGNDVQLYRALRETMGLGEAWVTNGIDTARFEADELDTLAAAP